MNQWMVVCAVLLLVCIIVCIRLIVMNQALRTTKKRLIETREVTNNRQIEIDLVNTQLTDLVTEINHNLDYQKQLKLEAEKSENHLKQSISDIAHDLRTPLTVIRGNLQMMEQNKNLSESDLAYLKTCQDKCLTLKNMVDDFFEMSVLESGDAKACLTSVDLTAFLMQLVIDHEVIIREASLTPSLTLPEQSLPVLADEKMLMRMMSNLLSNTVKYAKDTFSITVEPGTDDKHCQVILSNPIPPDKAPELTHLFERNYRGSSSRDGEGAGLGLYIVKLLAKQQGITVTAMQEGSNLAFCINFEKL